MSYISQAQLYGDAAFQQRSTSCATQQATVYKDDQRLSFVSLSNEVLRGNGDKLMAFARFNAAGPGIADKADNGDGTIDQSKVTDADLLSLTQANWQVVAGVYFNEDGTPIEG
jgi:hypothetical protein